MSEENVTKFLNALENLPQPGTHEHMAAMNDLCERLKRHVGPLVSFRATEAIDFLDAVLKSAPDRSMNRVKEDAAEWLWRVVQFNLGQSEEVVAKISEDVVRRLENVVAENPDYHTRKGAFRALWVMATNEEPQKSLAFAAMARQCSQNRYTDTRIMARQHIATVGKEHPDLIPQIVEIQKEGARETDMLASARAFHLLEKRATAPDCSMAEALDILKEFDNAATDRDSLDERAEFMATEFARARTAEIQALEERGPVSAEEREHLLSGFKRAAQDILAAEDELLYVIDTGAERIEKHIAPDFQP